MDSDDFTLDEDMYFINDALSVGQSSEPLTVKSGSTVYTLVPSTEMDASKMITINKPKTSQNSTASVFTLDPSGAVTKMSKITPTTVKQSISPQLIIPGGESKLSMTPKIVSIPSNPTLVGKTRPVESLKQKIIQLDRSYNEVKIIETFPAGQTKKVGAGVDEAIKISQELKPSSVGKPAIQLVYKNAMGNNVILCPTTRVKPPASSPAAKPSTTSSNSKTPVVPLISISKPVTDPPISIQQNRGLISGSKVTPLASYRLPQQVLKSTVLPGGTLHKIRVSGQTLTTSGQTGATPTIKVVRAQSGNTPTVLPLLNPGVKTVVLPAVKQKRGVLKGFNLGELVSLPGEDEFEKIDPSDFFILSEDMADSSSKPSVQESMGSFDVPIDLDDMSETQTQDNEQGMAHSTTQQADEVIALRSMYGSIINIARLTLSQLIQRGTSCLDENVATLCTLCDTLPPQAETGGPILDKSFIGELKCCLQNVNLINQISWIINNLVVICRSLQIETVIKSKNRTKIYILESMLTDMNSDNKSKEWTREAVRLKKQAEQEGLDRRSVLVLFATVCTKMGNIVESLKQYIRKFLMYIKQDLCLCLARQGAPGTKYGDPEIDALFRLMDEDLAKIERQYRYIMKMNVNTSASSKSKDSSSIYRPSILTARKPVETEQVVVTINVKGKPEIVQSKLENNSDPTISAGDTENQSIVELPMTTTNQSETENFDSNSIKISTEKDTPSSGGETESDDLFSFLNESLGKPKVIRKPNATASIAGNGGNGNASTGGIGGNGNFSTGGIGDTLISPDKGDTSLSDSLNDFVISSEEEEEEDGKKKSERTEDEKPSPVEPMELEEGAVKQSSPSVAGEMILDVETGELRARPLHETDGTCSETLDTHSEQIDGIFERGIDMDLDQDPLFPQSQQKMEPFSLVSTTTVSTTSSSPPVSTKSSVSPLSSQSTTSVPNVVNTLTTSSRQEGCSSEGSSTLSSVLSTLSSPTTSTTSLTSCQPSLAAVPSAQQSLLEFHLTSSSCSSPASNNIASNSTPKSTPANAGNSVATPTAISTLTTASQSSLTSTLSSQPTSSTTNASQSSIQQATVTAAANVTSAANVTASTEPETTLKKFPHRELIEQIKQVFTREQTNLNNKLSKLDRTIKTVSSATKTSAAERPSSRVEQVTDHSPPGSTMSDELSSVDEDAKLLLKGGKNGATKVNDLSCDEVFAEGEEGEEGKQKTRVRIGQRGAGKGGGGGAGDGKFIPLLDLGSSESEKQCVVELEDEDKKDKDKKKKMKMKDDNEEEGDTRQRMMFYKRRWLTLQRDQILETACLKGIKAQTMRNIVKPPGPVELDEDEKKIISGNDEPGITNPDESSSLGKESTHIRKTASSKPAAAVARSRGIRPLSEFDVMGNRVYSDVDFFPCCFKLRSTQTCSCTHYNTKKPEPNTTELTTNTSTLPLAPTSTILQKRKAEPGAGPNTKKRKNQGKPAKGSEMYCCKGCGCYGDLADFINRDYCSGECRVMYRKQQEANISNNSSAGATAPSGGASQKSAGAKPISEESLQVAYTKAAPVWSWKQYLQTGPGRLGRPAPFRAFRYEPSKPWLNSFRVGHKMEAKDPVVESRICVATCVAVKGPRIRVHFDAFPDSYDFWVNCNCPDLYPCGWNVQFHRRILAPSALAQLGMKTFSWGKYLQLTKSVPAPEACFACNHMPPSVFKIGRKLEAIDKKRSSLFHVATVKDVIGTRIRIHIDGADERSDYWTDIGSAYIRPVGWCRRNKVKLVPPPNVVSSPPERTYVFNWDSYLRATDTVQVPEEGFIQMPLLNVFEPGMKVEAVDPRCPGLIRVATVNAVEETRIKLGFDGFPSYLDTWFDYDSVDVHPPGWCRRMGHPLEPPVGGAIRRGECSTVGCSGRGHIDHVKYEFHTTTATCPYTTSYRPIYLTKDRLNGADQLLLMGPMEMQKKFTDERNVSPMDFNDEDSNSNSVISSGSRGGRGSEEDEEEDEEEVNVEVDVDADEKRKGNEAKRLKRSLQGTVKVPYSAYTRSPHPPPAPPLTTPSLSLELNKKATARLDQLREDIIRSVYNTGPQSGVRGSMYHWRKNLEPLGLGGEKEMKEDPAVWSKDEVVGFVKRIPGCDGAAGVFLDQQIDGFTFLLLSQLDLLQELGLKLGHATKIYNGILFLRQNTERAQKLLVQKLKPDEETEDSTERNGNSARRTKDCVQDDGNSTKETESIQTEGKVDGDIGTNAANTEQSQDKEAIVQMEVKHEDADTKHELLAQETLDIDMNTEDGAMGDECKPDVEDTEMKLDENIDSNTPTSTESSVDEVSKPSELEERDKEAEKSAQMVVLEPNKIILDQNLSEDISEEDMMCEINKTSDDIGNTEESDKTCDAKKEDNAFNEEHVENTELKQEDGTVTADYDGTVAADDVSGTDASVDVKDGDVSGSRAENTITTLKDDGFVEVIQESVEASPKTLELKDEGNARESDMQEPSSSEVSAPQSSMPMDTE
uniref:Lethal(3)malignant brain tumor-like protein 4 n=1 Tax=Cacopsylla melanoneura TaxID=428564 RepID=A0A8D8QCX2_9HEMI